MNGAGFALQVFVAVALGIFLADVVRRFVGRRDQ